MICFDCVIAARLVAGFAYLLHAPTAQHWPTRSARFSMPATRRRLISLSRCRRRMPRRLAPYEVRTSALHFQLRDALGKTPTKGKAFKLCVRARSC